MISKRKKNNDYFPGTFFSFKLFSFKLFIVNLTMGKAEEFKDELQFAYCGMNHSDTLDPISISSYSLSFNHHYKSFFFIMTLLSNESIIT